MNRPLLYQGYSVTMQEVPDEITLGFSIAGCGGHCSDCHSPHLWDYEGNLLNKEYEKVLDFYAPFITCVCLFGGEYNLEELSRIVHFTKIKYPQLKTAFYTGKDYNEEDIVDNILRIAPFDYIKVGGYRKELGGLDSKTTNQIMYKVKRENGNFILTNINEKFLKQ